MTIWNQGSAGLSLSWILRHSSWPTFTVICYAEGTLSFLLENLGFFSSSIDCLFAPFLSLTSSITFQLFQFIEDLVLSDVDASSEDSVFNTSSWFSRSSSRDAEKYVNYSILERKVLAFHEESNVYKLSETTNCHNQCATFIFHGLAHPLSGLTLAGRIAFASCRYLFSYIRCVKAKAYRIISRVKKTLQGSSGDIGWLQHTPGFAPVKDGTVRFRELLSVIRNGEHTLPNSYIYLLIPGLFSNHGPLYFVSTKRFFSRMGLACHIAKIHSEASVEHNAWELKHYIEELYWGSGKQVMLLGHSKGGVDAAAALSIYWDALKGKVAGLALVQSPYGGTPLASDILREGQIADKETRRIMELIICRLIKGDIRALEDLTYEKRKEFISKHKLPEQIPLISFHSEASIAPSVLATLTQIAHAELPWFPLPGFSYNDASMQAGRKVPVVVPVSAAMALCALHLQLRYGEKSDGLVTRRDAEVPGSVVVRPDRKLDHAWMVYSSWRKSPSEPDASEMYCEALLTMLVELSTMKKSYEDDSR